MLIFTLALRVLLVSPEAYHLDSGIYASGFGEETVDLGPKSSASHSQSFTFHSHAYACQHLTESTKVYAFLLVRESLIRLKACVYLLLRRFVFALWSRIKANAKRERLVTKREGPREGEKRELFSPFRLPLGANLHRKRDDWVRGRDRVMLEGNGPGICCFPLGVIAMKMKAWFGGKHSIQKIETVSFLTGGSSEWLFTRYRDQLSLRHLCPIKNSESGRGLGGG